MGASELQLCFGAAEAAVGDRHGLLCCRITEHWAAARVVGLVCGKRAIADFDNAYARVGLAGAWRGRAALRR